MNGGSQEWARVSTGPLSHPHLPLQRPRSGPAITSLADCYSLAASTRTLKMARNQDLHLTQPAAIYDIILNFLPHLNYFHIIRFNIRPPPHHRLIVTWGVVRLFPSWAGGGSRPC